MQAIEFTTKVEDGVIKVPQKYLSQTQDTVRVIILLEQSESTAETKKFHSGVELDTKGFKFDRDEANKR